MKALQNNRSGEEVKFLDTGFSKMREISGGKELWHGGRGRNVDRSLQRIEDHIHYVSASDTKSTVLPTRARHLK